ncbi:MAG: hypothetical protein V4617_06170 [Gemmatimonadota bacterium]
MRSLLPVRIAALFLAPAISPSIASAQSPVDGLKFRSIGPAVMGGRIHDVEVDPRDPSTIYIAAAGGGLWKTGNKGVTWSPIFDGQVDNSFGDVAIFAGDPRVVWAGTGEQNNRQSSTWGGGVYRSDDAGSTWKFLGLKASGSIGRVVLHPTDRNVAYIAAVGDLWKPTTERGVFRTTDGGTNWTRVLYVDTLTGAVDVVMDPSNPNTLYAATYQRLRSVFGFNGGGPGSALWKSVDAGATWQKLESGVPPGDKGRIGIAIAQSNPRVLVATIEQTGTGGTYRSEDAGATWKRMSATNPRPMYYSHPSIDPTNDKRIWMMGVQPAKSEDGGATFQGMPNSPTYDLGLKDDHHALWIDPANPRHLLLGGDGGLHESFDLGYTYARINNFAIGQFYRIAVDDRDPYWIYGGMQDAHSWMGPSSTRHWLGILNQDWKQIGFSDGTGHAVDLRGPRYVYSTSSGGNITRVDVESGDRWDIQPVPPRGESYRFDWTAPVVASRHKPGTVYLGANKLLMSNDFGSSWTASADLTRKVNRDTLRMAGVLNTEIRHSRNDGETTFSEITTIAESPLDPLVLWAGTDDGNVQVSRDGGKTFTAVHQNITGVKDGSFIDRIVASGAGKGTAYVTIENHRSGDFAPYIFRTTDFGRTWKPVREGLPDGNPVRSIAEFPGHPNVLFVGTERFVHFTVDSGAHWSRVTANLPPTRYDDIVVHPRTKDLVLGTHGRSIWVLDDATPFVELPRAAAAQGPTLMPVRPATLMLYWADVSTAAHAIYAAENPAEGATFSYHLPRAATSVKFTVRNAAGKTIRELTGPTVAGTVHRINWDLRYAPTGGGGFGGGGGGEEGGGPPDINPGMAPGAPGAAAGAPGRGAGGGGGGGGGGRGNAMPALPIPVHNIGARGIHVSPGKYTVTMDVDGTTGRREFDVRADPALPMTLADHKAREAFLLEVIDVQARITTATAAFRTKLAAATGAEAERLNGIATQLGMAGGGRGGRGGGGGGPAASIGRIVGAYNGSGVRHGSLQAPSKTQRDGLAEAKRGLALLESAVR